MRALVTGATGFIGATLLPLLDRPVVLSRDADRARARLAQIAPGATAFSWNPLAGPPSDAALDGIDVVFHLAGEPVAEGRWTDEKKRRILDSRVIGTRHLVDAIASRPASERPRVLVCASAVGYYGTRGDELLDEDSRPGQGFLADVCVAWEREARRAENLGLRVARTRIGVVLGEGEGALGRMTPLFKAGIGGRIGDGRQYMPWIHVEDAARLLLHAATTEAVSGAMNLVAPDPPTNAAFTAALAHALHRPAILPVPAFALRIAFGELASVLLASQRVVPRVAERTGFRFAHPTLDEAMMAAVHPSA